MIEYFMITLFELAHGKINKLTYALSTHWDQASNL